MQRKKLNTRGFSLVAILVTILACAVLASAGYLVWRKSNEAKTANTTSATHTSSVSKVSQVTPAPQPQPVDPYAGWKTYADAQGNYSFKYPADWTLITTGGQVTVLDSAKTTEVDYVNPYAHDSGLLGFFPVSTDAITVGGRGLVVVGGVYTPANEADYGIVDASQLQTYPLTLLSPAQFPNALRFTDIKDDSMAVAFRARRTTQFSSVSDAQAWFATSDAKTSLLVLKSLAFTK